MIVSLNLNDFKSSGVYIREHDASESIQLNTNITRLIVGYSRKGPFNRPVFLRDAKDARNIFGPIDTFLEKRGSYFHRAIYSALEVAPVFAISLMPLNNDPNEGPVDTIPYQAFSLSTTQLNGVKRDELLASFFDQVGFWKEDTESFIANVEKPSSPNQGSLLNITNLSTTPLSCIVVKTERSEVPQFNITANEWFNGDVPNYVDPDDLISDYFIDVHIVAGNWDNYTALSVNPIYGQYFTPRGIRKNRLRDFMALSEVKYFGRYTGSVIPGLEDGANVVYSIDSVINQNIGEIGLFVAINEDALDKYDALSTSYDPNDSQKGLDLVGHTIANSQEIIGTSDIDVRPTPDALNFLSYSFGIRDKYEFEKKEYWDYSGLRADLQVLLDNTTIEHMHLGGRFGYFFNRIVIERDREWGPNNRQFLAYERIKNTLVPEKSFIVGSFDKNIPQYTDLDVLVNGSPIDKTEIRKMLISQVFETTGEDGQTKFLNLVLSHPQKRFEMQNFSNGIALRMLGDKFTNEFIPNTDPKKPNPYYAKFIHDDGITTITVDKKFVEDLQAIDNDFNPDDRHIIANRANRVWFYTMFEASGDDYIITIEDPFNSITRNDQNGMDFLQSNFTLYSNRVNIVRPDYNGVEKLLEEPLSNGKQLSIALTLDVLSNVSGELRAYRDNKVAIYLNNNIIQTGDKVNGKNIFNNIGLLTTDDAYIPEGFIRYDSLIDFDGFEYYHIVAHARVNRRFSATGMFEGLEFVGEAFELEFEKTPTPDNRYILTVEDTGVSDDAISRTFYERIPIIQGTNNATNTVFRVSLANADNISRNDYIVSKVPTDETGVFRYKLSAINSKMRKLDAAGNWVVEITTQTPVYFVNGEIIRFISVNEYANIYKVFTLSGFRLNESHLPGTENAPVYTQPRQLRKILEVLDPINTRLRERLASIDSIDFRYIVDTFDGGIEPMTGPKVQLTRLAKERQQCLAFINFPSFRLLSKSTNPRFTTIPTDAQPKPVIDTSLIATGGNMELNPSNLLSLVDEFWGAKYTGYIAPFKIIRENGKNFGVPMAVDFSNLYVLKHLNGEPDAIVAGTRRGVISDPKMVGVEYDFLKSDADNLEPMGLNIVRMVKGVGYCIYSNQMAYQRTRSAFNNLHVRDVLITIERDITEILRYYLFEKNNDIVRLEIYNRVKAYLDTKRVTGAIVDHKVVMNSSNNPPVVIDNSMGIIDIYIDVVRGFHKFLANIIVTGTGGVSTTSFENVIS